MATHTKLEAGTLPDYGLDMLYRIATALNKELVCHLVDAVRE